MIRHPFSVHLGGAPVEDPPQLRLLGIPVRIEPAFLLVAALFGVRGGALGVAVAMVVITKTLLFHELCHAKVAQRFGCHPHVTLRGYGSVTRGVEGLSGWRLLLVALAGPTASLAVALLAWAGARASASTSPVHVLLVVALRVNLGWTALSLLPTRGFDGGTILRALFGGERHFASSLAGVGILLATGVALAFSRQEAWTLVACALALVGAVVELAGAAAERGDERAGRFAQLKRAEELLDEGELQHVERAATHLVADARSDTVRTRARVLSLLVHVARRDPVEACRVFMDLPGHAVMEVETIAALQDLLGHPHDARVLLLETSRRQRLSRRGARLLVDLFARDGDLRAAVELAASCDGILTAADRRKIAEAAEAGGIDATCLRTADEPPSVSASSAAP